MDIEREAAGAQRPGPDPNNRLDIERFEHGIDADVVPVPDDMGEIHRLAVDQDQIDFGVRHPEPFDHVLDGRAPLEFVNEADLAARERQKVVQLLVKPHLALAFQQRSAPRKLARPGRGSWKFAKLLPGIVAERATNTTPFRPRAINPSTPSQ
jgi:hypothetical protein